MKPRTMCAILFTLLFTAPAALMAKNKGKAACWIHQVVFQCVAPQGETIDAKAVTEAIEIGTGLRVTSNPAQTLDAILLFQRSETEWQAGTAVDMACSSARLKGCTGTGRIVSFSLRLQTLGGWVVWQKTRQDVDGIITVRDAWGATKTSENHPDTLDMLYRLLDDLRSARKACTK
jgi:hypothetical protein